MQECFCMVFWLGCFFCVWIFFGNIFTSRKKILSADRIWRENEHTKIPNVLRNLDAFASVLHQNNAFWFLHPFALDCSTMEKKCFVSSVMPHSNAGIDSFCRNSTCEEHLCALVGFFFCVMLLKQRMKNQFFLPIVWRAFNIRAPKSKVWDHGLCLYTVEMLRSPKKKALRIFSSPFACSCARNIMTSLLFWSARMGHYTHMECQTINKIFVMERWTFSYARDVANLCAIVFTSTLAITKKKKSSFAFLWFCFCRRQLSIHMAYIIYSLFDNSTRVLMCKIVSVTV